MSDDQNILNVLKVAGPLSAMASLFRMVFDPEGIGFWRGTGTVLGGMVAGILAGDLMSQAHLASIWEHGITAAVSFLARDIALVLVKVARGYRDNPAKLVHDIQELREGHLPGEEPEPSNGPVNRDR